VVTGCCRQYLISCTKLERIYDASDKRLVVKKKSSWTPCKEVHFIYSWKFRNRLLPDSQYFIEQVPVYEKVVKHLQGQSIKKRPKKSGLKRGWIGRRGTKITEENQRNQYYTKISCVFPFQTIIFQYFTLSTVMGKSQA